MIKPFFTSNMKQMIRTSITYLTLSYCTWTNLGHWSRPSCAKWSRNRL